MILNRSFRPASLRVGDNYDNALAETINGLPGTLASGARHSQQRGEPGETAGGAAGALPNNVATR